jgi:hypothetical protein
MGLERIDLKRITKVFHGLLDLLESENLVGNLDRIPPHILSLVQNFYFAHGTFNEGINEYMHKRKRDVSEFKTVERVVEEGPVYLAVEDKSGRLPIDCAACDNSSASTYVPFLAKVCIRHGVLIDESKRGGLLIRDTRDRAPLHMLVGTGNLDALKALQNSKPPLFKTTDISTQNLIISAVSNGQLDMMKWLIHVNPGAVYSSHQQSYLSGTLAIHCAQQSFEATKYLLESAIKYDPHHSSIGGLFTKNHMGVIAIDLIIRQLGKEKAMKCIEESLSTNKDIPILHKVILHTPEHIDDIITSFPDSCFLRDENGRLPIHVALETGIKWSTSLMTIMNSNSEHLDEIDPVTKFCPIALAAVEPSSDLRTINYLLQKHPKQVQFSTKKMKNKVRSKNSDDLDEHKNKRQRINSLNYFK